MKNEKRSKAPLFSFNNLFYDFTKLTAALPAVIWLRPKLIYESKAAKRKLRGGALVIANHCSFSDPIYLMAAIWYRRHNFVCLKMFFETKAKLFFKWFNCIPIDTENFGMDSFRSIVEHLKAGKLVSMYPEGHVNMDDNGIKTFKSSMVLISLKANAPIVPVYIMPPKRFWNRMIAVIGEPINIAAACGERPNFKQIEETARLLKEKEENLKNFIK